MRWENMKHLFGIRDEPSVDEVIEIDPRPLNEREANMITAILHANEQWDEADVSHTKVIAEGYWGRNGTNYCVMLGAPAPENKNMKSDNEGVGQLWINLDDGSVINAQLTQSKGQLQVLYLIYVDPKNPRRKIPMQWRETYREAVRM